MERIIGIVIALGALSLIFWVLESLFAARPEQAGTAKRRGFVTDLIYWFTTPLLNRTVSQVGIVLTLMLVYQTNVTGIKELLNNRDTFPASLPAWIQVPAMLLTGDFIGYWMHRAFHRGPLWRFHTIHHSSEDLDWLSSVRVHPVNAWISRWVQATGLILLGFTPLAVVAYVPFLTFYAIMLHANVRWSFGPLGHIVASPKFHQWHHTAEEQGLDKNFAGLFPIWDRLFGTYYMPTDRFAKIFGLRDETIANSFMGQLIHPFKKTNL